MKTVFVLLLLAAALAAATPYVALKSSQRFTPTQDDAGFGSMMSVDASGNYAVFGNLGAGSVTIFRINGVTASQFQRIVPTDNQSDDQFGWAVDIDLPFVAMSARGFNTSAGKVYIYSNGGTDGAQFTLHQIVTSGNAHAADFFGASVSIKNGFLAVGADGDDTGATNAGTAWVFFRDSSAAVGSQWKLMSAMPIVLTPAVSNVGFGGVVDLSGSGDALAIASPGSAPSGQVSLYTRSGTTWSKTGSLSESTIVEFGLYLSYDHPLVLVGGSNGNPRIYDASTLGVVATPAPSDGDFTQIRQLSILSGGRAAISNSLGTYFFAKSGSAWNEVIRLDRASSSDTNYGRAVGLAGTDRIVIGSSGWFITSTGGAFYVSYLFCSSGKIGTDCSGSCSCIYGTCSDGLSGTGLCKSCSNNTVYGTNCDKVCQCGTGVTCSSGIAGTGVCAACQPGYYGASCLPCSCRNGTCNDGNSGDGLCVDCYIGYAGANCDLKCSCKNGICSEGITGNATCRCYPNFSGTSCEFGNECIDGTAKCSSHAVCTDTPTSYNCTCKAGYAGDGYACNDIDECLLGTAQCDPNAQCTNTPAGNYSCACKSGFTGSGRTCSSMNECLNGINNCDPWAICTDTASGFTCECGPGFNGTGTVCTDFNECTASNTSCLVGTCVNYPGSRACITSGTASIRLAWAQAFTTTFPALSDVSAVVTPGVPDVKATSWKILDNSTVVITVTNASALLVVGVQNKFEFKMYLPDNSLLAALDKTDNLLFLTRNVPVRDSSATLPSTSTLALVVLAALVALFQCSR